MKISSCQLKKCSTHLAKQETARRRSSVGARPLAPVASWDKQQRPFSCCDDTRRRNDAPTFSSGEMRSAERFQSANGNRPTSDVKDAKAFDLRRLASESFQTTASRHARHAATAALIECVLSFLSLCPLALASLRLDETQLVSRHARTLIQRHDQARLFRR